MGGYQQRTRRVKLVVLRTQLTEHAPANTSLQDSDWHSV